MVALVAGLCVQKPEGIEPTLLQPAEELKLSDFPEAFKDSTLIIVGDNTSDIEMQAANEIAEYLENETGNKPLIKKYSEISDEDKRNYNLIVVGTPKTNPLLEEVYAMTNATRVTEEFPGEGKGVLEILPNPWDESKAMLIIYGKSEKEALMGSLLIFNRKLVNFNDTRFEFSAKNRIPIDSYLFVECIIQKEIRIIDGKCTLKRIDRPTYYFDNKSGILEGRVDFPINDTLKVIFGYRVTNGGEMSYLTGVYDVPTLINTEYGKIWIFYVDENGKLGIEFKGNTVTLEKNKGFTYVIKDIHSSENCKLEEIVSLKILNHGLLKKKSIKEWR